MNRLFDLTGKTALVTGCSRGIGEAIAIGLAEAGADIIGVSNSLTEASPVATAVINAGRNFKAFSSDFSDRPSLYKFIEQISSEQIDILVNNAGMIHRAPAADHPDEAWDKVMAVNLDAQFILSREIGKTMVARGSGKIIFICSLLSFQGGINVPGYAASKGAVASLVKAFSNEWAGRGVNVNGIAPGYIATDNTKALREDKERSRSILERIPAGRWGNPADIAGPAVFLSSEAASYIYGTILTVDGGWMAR
jgi:2-dehydro-3-deoxy-D-gluconate 5-dehydrogenase